MPQYERHEFEEELEAIRVTSGTSSVGSAKAVAEMENLQYLVQEM